MRLERLCAMDLVYVGGAHVLRPYGNEAGLGWGAGEGTVTGERLSGDVRWSNHPTRRGDGTMLPNVRGLITTTDNAHVMFDLTGRTVWVEIHGETTGRQLLMTLFEAEDERYTWLNNIVCISEGAIDPVKLSSHFEVHTCHSDML
ncbi:MAG: DUF3237 family protein [Nocardioidaceae bacterium]